MIRVETRVKLPFLWGKAVFKKEYWSQVNLIVGPNGSGKTLLANELARQFESAGYSISFLRSDRDSQTDSVSVLIDNQEIRNKIENVLSGMFNKSISFVKTDDGSVVPVVVNKNMGLEYNLKEGECHGFKEIITLLTALYDDSHTCLFLDEPELHLHPQFQQFFMNEIRRVAKLNPRKIFFLITHSPYFIDLRFPDDLIGVVACHVNNLPSTIEMLDDDLEQLFRRFLPRFNTYHKQFFFSDNQIFVEGYTDQQMFSNLLSIVEDPMKAVRTGIIDVGGKDELGVFCTVCSLLGTDGRIITDLDSLFGGKVREVVNHDERTVTWLEKQAEKQESFYLSIFTLKELENKITLQKLIHKLEQMIGQIGKFVSSIDFSITPDFDLFVEKVINLCEKYDKAENLDTYKTVVLQGILNLEPQLRELLPLPLAKQLPLLKNLFYFILAAFETSRVYILSKGCIEHYYTQNFVHYMPVSGKDRLFHAELEHLIHGKTEKLRHEYGELLEILERALKCS